MWKSADNCLSLDEACDRIEKTVKAVYKEYGHVFQPGLCPSVDLIYGVKMDDKSRMFSARGPIVNEVESYCAGGLGYYMADFLAARMNPNRLSLHQCVILAAYI